MRKKHRVFTIMMATVAAVLLLVACQPTPDAQAVVNRIDSPLDELVLEKADPNEAWPQPEAIVWDETRTVDSGDELIGQYTVAVSIDAQTPEYPEKVPVVIIERDYFDDELLTKAAKCLLKGEIFNGMPSKQDVTAEILNFKKEISAHNIIAGYQEQVDEQLAFLNEKYEEAADDNSEAKFEFEDLGGLKAFDLKSYPDGGSIMTFTAYGSTIYFYTNEFNKEYAYFDNARDKNVQANGINTTYEQAHAIADEAMETMFNDPLVMTRSNILDKINRWDCLWNEGEQTSLEQAYEFYYSRVYDGYASLFIEPAVTVGTDEEETMYTKIYPREYVSIVVDDKGIVSMNYQSYSHTLKIVNDDVKLMPFADILERFKNEAFYHNLWGTSQADIKITRIDFGMVREPVKDNPDQYMMVPAWNFIGDISSDCTDGQGVSIIALNAINGSVITDYPLVYS